MNDAAVSGRFYEVFDVFADKALAGNPLAVVHDSEGLTDARMQAIAREFNLSETVFIFPRTIPHMKRQCVSSRLIMSFPLPGTRQWGLPCRWLAVVKRVMRPTGSWLWKRRSVLFAAA